MPDKINILEQNITSTLELNYMPYVMSVILSRAIPEIDGFKPAHRKLLYTMYKMGLLNGNRVKSADVVGQTMRLNPHGDGAIYETLVRLARGNEALLHPFIDSKGNFGKQTSRDMSYAASRYTEVKLDSICSEIFRDIEKDTVDFVDNYNGSTKEPTLFPTTFPNLLVTPNQGIAVGMASTICSFNLKEVCNATINFIKNANVDFKKYLLAPDFSTGGQLIYNEKEIDTVYETGRGSFKVRSKYRFDKKNSCIEIYEIPYTTTIEVIVDKIINLVKQNKVREINDVRDETDLNGLKITIDIKKNSDPDLLMNKLFNMTTLQDSFSSNFNILIEGKPMTMGIREILSNWCIFRIKCLRRQISFDINKKNEKFHLLTGLSKIILDIDRAIKIIRETEEDSMVITNLANGFNIDNIQAEYVAEIKLRNLNKEYLLNRISELDNLKKEIEDLEALLNSDLKIKELICNQLKDISKKFGKPRKTEIIHENTLVAVEIEDYIEDYPLKIFLTEHNYFKKISLVSLRYASDQNIKEDDKIIQELETTNKSDILLFSNKQNVYKAKAYDLPDCKASAMGEYLTNLLKISDEDERIIYIVDTIDYSGFILFGYANGKIAKVSLENYETKVNRKKLINAYSSKSPCIFIDYIVEDKNYVAIRNCDKASLFSSKLLDQAPQKSSPGTQILTLKKKSSMCKVLKDLDFVSDNIEYYRTNKLPTGGHFILDKDKNNVQ